MFVILSTLISFAKTPWRLIRGGSCESTTKHQSILCLSHAFRCSSAEPRKVLKVRYGLVTGGRALRFAATYDEQSFARRYHGGGYAPGDGCVDDGDDALKTPDVRDR